MNVLRTAVTVVLLAGAAPWHIALAEPGDWYLGLGAGRSQSKLDDAELTREVGTPGFAPTAVFRDDHGQAFKLFGGLQLSN